MDEGGGGFVRQPDVHQVTTTKTGLMNTIATSRPMSQELAPVGESLRRRWLKNILTAALAGVLWLVLIGVTRTVSALITGGSTGAGR